MLIDDEILIMIVAARNCLERHTWREIGAVVGLTSDAASGRFRRAKDRIGSLDIACPVCKSGPSQRNDNVENPINKRVSGNYTDIAVEGTRIKTLDQLLEYANVDLTIWRVSSWEVKAWNMGAKVKVGHLRWEDGRQTGNMNYEGIGVETLWSVSAKLLKINPEPIHPTIMPFDYPDERISFPTTSSGIPIQGKALIMGDPHFGFTWELPPGRLRPFHDRRVLDLFCQLIQIVRPDIVEILGDILDLAAWTDRFARRPEFFRTTQPTLCEANWWFRRIRSLMRKSAKLRVHAGNHDERMINAAMSHLAEASELRPVDQPDADPALSVPGLLGLRSLGAEWIGDYPHDWSWLGTATKVSHGHIARNVPLKTVGETLRQGVVNRIVGHIHRDELVSERIVDHERNDKIITGYCPGCSCHIDGRVPHKGANNWRQGIGVAYYNGDNLTITHIPVRNGVLVYNDMLLEAKPVEKSLKRSFPEWNWG